MRILVTGGHGFVGSNLVAELREQNHEVLAPDRATIDLCEEGLVRRVVAATRPDAIVHAAIWNDPSGLTQDRRRAWTAYVQATRHLVDAANAAGARIVLISTDWVFDGTQGPAAEADPPNPINPYGWLKAASELVVTQRAERGTVARIAAVQGVHRGGRELPRAQDAGFGYLSAALVGALRRGRTFTVWDGDGLNRLATPTLASDAARLVGRALDRDLGGILHLCGREHVDRVTLAHRVVAAFGLDEAHLRVAPPPGGITGGASAATGRIPVDTRLDARVTAERLDTTLPDLDAMLGRLRAELEETWSPSFA
jgi:dTDP-4-dehydrorhamnose reductase